VAKGRVPTDQLQIVDAHSHLINLGALEYPWIRHRVPALEALLDNYYDIAHDSDVDAYLSDVADERLIKSVASEFGAGNPGAEAEWVQRCADTHGFPQAFIAGVDPMSPALADLLQHYRDLPVVRAVRQPLYWADDPLRRFGARPDYLGDPTWLRGFELIAAEGLVWDLLVYDEQLPSAHELIASFPNTQIVLEAGGWPLDQSPAGFRRWQERLEEVSQFPNVTLKMQGLALLFAPPSEALGPWVGTALRIFGPNRSMFATHFPVDRLLWSFDELVQSVSAIVADRSADEQEAFFSGCARRVYRL
jgi:predicted TIM-barrel fold metal-dependent hydrolase